MMTAELWVAVWVALIGFVGVVVAAVVNAAGQRRRQVEQGRKLDQIRGQVENSHGTNLRDDLDSLAGQLQRVASYVGDTRADLGLLRSELRTLRRDLAEVHASDVDATQEHARLWHAIKGLIGGKE